MRDLTETEAAHFWNTPWRRSLLADAWAEHVAICQFLTKNRRDPMNFVAAYDSDGKITGVTVDTFSPMAGISTPLLATPYVATTVRIQVDNGSATYRVTGVDASGHVLFAELESVESFEPPEVVGRDGETTGGAVLPEMRGDPSS